MSVAIQNKANLLKKKRKKERKKNRMQSFEFVFFFSLTKLSKACRYN